MRGRAVSQAQWKIYAEHRAMGLSQTDAARMASVSVSAARAWESRRPDRGNFAKAARAARNQPDPRRRKDLGPEALRALDDFDYFQLRYLGRIPIAWQAEAAERIAGLLATDDKEYCVINCCPGAGKSTTFTYAIPLWLTARDRAIRGLVGSATSRLAGQYTANIRRALEAVVPIQADDEDKQKGIAVDAEATMSEDFGRFKPMDHDSWTKDAFIVEQYDGASITSKEPTWTAVGRDQEFIGGRYDFCIWDDLVTSNRLRTIEMIEKDRDWWDSYAERRLEPGGLLILQGQRMGANDLYRYALDMEVLDIEDEADDDNEGVSLRVSEEGTPRKYHHIIFKAHYEDRCNGASGHRRDSAPYPDGCLLSPRRVTWREVASIQKNRPDTFAQVYQQEDVSPQAVLVDPAWISGFGSHPGCWDMDRDRLEIPRGLVEPNFSIVSVDPSPTRYWGIIWWYYNQASEQWFLIDLERKALDAPDFLDWSHNMGEFTGLMRDWQETSVELGAPITHWIVERNGAQRFLFAYEHYRRFQSKYQVEIVPHDTHRNKVDDEFGVQMIAPPFKYGQVRLPGKVSKEVGVGVGRAKSLKLVDEVTRYPQSSTTDLVMSTWFAMYQMQYLAMPAAPAVKQKRPSWLSSRRAA